MRERLIELIEQARLKTWGKSIAQEDAITADYLLDNGVIVPQLKVGDRVFSKPYRYTLIGDAITQIKINRGGIHYKCWWGYFHQSDIGKTVFVTKEEAEQKLAELQSLPTLPILHGNVAPSSKEEAMERLGLRDKLSELKGE